MSRARLFERLANTPPGRVAVVTPTRRLARALASEADAWQVGQGARVWQTPEILPIQAFVSSLYERAQHDPALTGIRAPLTTAQAGALWHAVVTASEVPLASTAGAAAMAAEAWALAHQWAISARMHHYAQSEDTRIFMAWARDYQQRVDEIGAIDPVHLTDAVRDLVQEGNASFPGEVVFAAFDEFTPQQSALIDALEAAGAQCDRWTPAGEPGTAARMQALDARDEVERMADWAAARLAANPDVRIGVVVPDLANRRCAIARALDAALQPDALLAVPDRLRPYTLSLGDRFSDVPLIATALRTLRLAVGSLPFADASALIRSRYVVFGEADACDRLDARFRRRVGHSVTLDQLLGSALTDDGEFDAARQSLQALAHWRAGSAQRRQRLSEWAVLLTDALRCVHFPGALPLASDEFQTLARWRELIAEFAALARVTPPLDAEAAVDRLVQLAASTVFQPEGGDPPIQVIGLRETAGLQFDHLWLMGATAETWPASTRPHPLLPLELQRAARMPGALADVELARARAFVHRLSRSAGEVIASHAARDGEQPLAASPLIVHWPVVAPPGAATRARDAIAQVPLERFDDAMAPPLPAAALLIGGASILKDQAACPFRAFAKHRLGAEPLEEPHDGFDASERGQLIHHVLARFWQSLPQPSRAALARLPDGERTRMVERAADEALARLRRRRGGAVGEALTAVERGRLVRIVTRWLDFELAARADFEVIATEERRALAVGPLALRGRLDRIDRLPDGRTIVIDYKTGINAGARSWMGARPDEPQLPLYLTASEAAGRAIAFARVTAGEPRFIAFADDESMLPGASSVWRDEHASWNALMDAWRQVLGALAQEFADGRADVAPQRGSAACRQCDLAVFCRVSERATDGAVDAINTGQPDER